MYKISHSVSPLDIHTLRTSDALLELTNGGGELFHSNRRNAVPQAASSIQRYRFNLSQRLCLLLQRAGQYHLFSAAPTIINSIERLHSQGIQRPAKSLSRINEMAATGILDQSKIPPNRYKNLDDMFPQKFYSKSRIDYTELKQASTRGDPE